MATVHDDTRGWGEESSVYTVSTWQVSRESKIAVLRDEENEGWTELSGCFQMFSAEVIQKLLCTETQLLRGQ